jgi:hypothetical protein
MNHVVAGKPKCFASIKRSVHTALPSKIQVLANDRYPEVPFQEVSNGRVIRIQLICTLRAAFAGD